LIVIAVFVAAGTVNDFTAVRFERKPMFGKNRHIVRHAVEYWRAGPNPITLVSYCD
jgi:hypothetical protein